MKTKISTVFLVASLFLTTMPFALAQTSTSDWSAVRQLSAGTDLLIKTADGQTFIGSAASVKDDEIELTVKGRSFVLAKNNLKAIYFAVPKTGRRARGIGALVGVIAALAAYGAAVGDEGDSGTGAPVIPFFGGGLVGGYIGGLFGRGRKKGALIYQAQ